MISFREPATMMLALAATTAVVGAVGAVGEGFAAEAQGEAEAEDLKQAARAERIAGARAVRDEQEEQKLRTARMLAIAGAGGRGSDLLGVISRDEQESAIRQHRIRADTAARASGLMTRASNVREAGDAARRGSFFKAGTTLLEGGLTMKALAPTPKATKYPTTPAYRTGRTGRLAGPV